MKRLLIFTFASAVAVLPASVFARAGELETPGIAVAEGGDLGDVIAVLRDKNFKYLEGRYINASTDLYYDGDAADLSRFLKALVGCRGVTVDLRFATLKKRDGVVIDSTLGFPRPVPCRWQVSHNGWGDASRITVTAFVGEEGLDPAGLSLPSWRSGHEAAPASPPKAETGVLRVGDMAPPVTALFSSGDALIPEEPKGKQTLIVFWSPGEATGPLFADLHALRREFAGDDRLRIVSVCVDPSEDGWDRWLKFLEGRETSDRTGKRRLIDDPMWWNVFQGDGERPASVRYGVRSMPEAFLAGPDGRLAAVRIPREEWRKVVAEALSEPPADSTRPNPGPAAAGD